MAARWRRLVASVGVSFLVAAGIAGCERALVIPSGAHIGSDGAELMFIGGANPESGGLVGLTDEQLDAVLRGDLVHTSISSGFRSGGELGNANELGNLPAGNYLFLPDGIVILEPGAYDSIPVDAVAVLEVVP